ncbi:MAG: hypothetical protein ABIH35_04290 [Patescibacteria group bacterium]
MFTFETLAACVGKERNTVAKFFSRKRLSIRRPADVKKYLEHLARGKQWRTSTYAAPHLAPHRYRRQRSLRPFPRRITNQFPRYIFWDRPAESVPRDDFIRRVVRYGTFIDMQKMLKIIPPKTIKTVYKNRSELLADTKGGLIRIK